MKKLLLTITLILTPTLLHATAPQPGQSVWNILNIMGQKIDAAAPTLINNLGGTYTINTPGNYKLENDATGQISIEADNVCLNLNCRKIEHNDHGDDIISVQANRKNVRIFNGKIVNTDTTDCPRSGSGILVNSGCSLITLDHLEIANCGNGVKFAGVHGTEVFGCTVESCTFFENCVGLFGYHSDETIIRNCAALRSGQTGFELQHSSYNCIFNCKAVSTQGETTATAFRSESGKGNLFKECAAKHTETDAWEFCTKAYGFLLTGTEEKTKIIDCVVNETDMTSTVSAVAYGIHLLPVLKETAELLSIIDSVGPESSNTFYSVAWSPNNQYFSSGSFASPYLRVFSFDGSNITLIDSDTTPGGTVLSTAWSSDGSYIATGDAGNRTRVFNFDGANLTPLSTSANLVDDVTDVDWSPDDNYLASVTNDGYLRIFSFDGAGLSLVSTSSFDLGSWLQSVSWSPDGDYLVTGDQDRVRIFSFNGSQLNNVANYSFGSTQYVLSVAWSPLGAYIAAGDGLANVHAFSFAPSTNTITPLDTDSTPNHEVNSVAWSPDGKYIASIEGRTSTSTGADAIIRIFGFANDQLTQIDSYTDSVSDSSYFSVAWSAGGDYVASGGGSWDDDTGMVRIFEAMYGPASCLIKGNCVCDTSSYGMFVGFGIAGSVANNGIICNTCCNNEVNYTYGIPNVYDMLSSNTDVPVNLADNLACD